MDIFWNYTLQDDVCKSKGKCNPVLLFAYGIIKFLIHLEFPKEQLANIQFCFRLL